MRNKMVIRNIVMLAAAFVLLAASFMAGRVSMAYMTDTVLEDESNIIAVVNLAYNLVVVALVAAVDPNLSLQISQTKLDDIMSSLRSDVVSPLLNRADEVKHAFQSSYADSDGKLSTFQSSLTAYDPLGHIDSSAIQDSYADMHDSTSSLQ